MCTTYTIEPIAPRTIDRAFPVAQVVAPGVSRQEWRRVCQSCFLPSGQLDQEPRERIVVAVNSDGYVKGLCVYTPRDHPAYGRMLDVPFLVPASAADNLGVATALSEFLQAECKKFDASCIRYWAMDADTWTRRGDAEYIARSDHGLTAPFRRPI
jgi:hypothetical protein